MKKLAVVAAVAGLAIGAAVAQGADSTGKGIVGSVHDLSGRGTGASGYNVSDPGQRICAFCHSPHHSANTNLEQSDTVANLDGTAAGTTYNIYAPLWSRDMSNQKVPDAYVSQTFNPSSLGKPYDPLIGPSRLCLTCHDGTIALDSYYGNKSMVAVQTFDEFNGPEGGGGVKSIGIAADPKGLSNDHPIGMRYSDFLGAKDENDTPYELMPTSTNFVDTTNTKTAWTVQSVLYRDPMDSTNVKDFVTCASCHDVHNGNAVGNKAPASNMRGFLLYGSQVNSAFCLTCHNKNGLQGVPDGTPTK
ncbi:hypothetical protein KP004_14520 [Geomonas oryzisoli]|uniref:Doubled CXXCH motif domain-containing protein n=1 Tax=Geomonas oryzisoli TaxID=2847992 RepID=A0ABX8J6Q6_9BACT|nr:hypothetical protein [Geomonas oryzisoli]QWV92412.1 hypothetical protein KP004_14520 [Geomonas oryzisoli]